MALEHALLVALRERPASGLELARRFDRSIGFFWHATHQQIYRVLARMEGDGWVVATPVAQTGRPDKKEYAVSAAGRAALADWLAADSPVEPLRSELAVKLRGAAYGDRSAVRRVVEAHLADHRTRLAAYEQMAAEQYPDPDALTGADRDRWLVLRGGIRLEEFWIGWLTEYLQETR
ncbi:PadR family transcriptional regulator [Nocardioides sp. GXQ0305]|uniref:PadR family transcriptional regulator n=1 Tax=Nocardioides sp. GXQ0305 TaxID=3423912 RepID=UPI003D7D812D